MGAHLSAGAKWIVILRHFIIINKELLYTKEENPPEQIDNSYMLGRENPYKED